MAAPILPEQLTERFLRSMRKQFYGGNDKFFFQERDMLVRAICHPASYLDDRGVRLNSARYQIILTKVIRTINEHGNLREVRSPGRYLLHAVQEHMKHHGDEYYEQAKATRSAIADALAGLKPRTCGAIQSVDSTVPDLAKVHRILSLAKPRGRKPVATPVQGDFFAPAKPVQAS